MLKYITETNVQIQKKKVYNLRKSYELKRITIKINVNIIACGPFPRNFSNKKYGIHFYF